MGKSSIPPSASAVTLGDLPQNLLGTSHEGKAHTVEDDAHKLNSALTRLHDAPELNSNPETKPGLQKPNPASTSHPGLYRLNERDDWLLSKEPMASAPHRI